MKYYMLILFLAMSVSLMACNDGGPASQAGAETSAQPAAQAAYGIGIGDKAPDFELKNVDGKMYALSTITDANGNKPKGYIVIFTCNTCPYAVANEQRIISLHNEYAPQGYPVVAVQPNDPAVQPGDSFAAMQKRAKEKGYPFLYLFDEGQKVFPQYGATRTPEVFLLDNGLTLRYHGAIDDSPRDEEGVQEKFLENAIEAMENGGNPSPATTKAVGCGIKTA